MRLALALVAWVGVTASVAAQVTLPPADQRIEAEVAAMRARGNALLEAPLDALPAEQLDESLLPDFAAWELRSAAGELIESGGRAPVLRAPAGSDGAELLVVDDGILVQAQVRMAAGGGEGRRFTGAITLQAHPLTRLAGIARPALLGADEHLVVVGPPSADGSGSWTEARDEAPPPASESSTPFALDRPSGALGVMLVGVIAIGLTWRLLRPWRRRSWGRVLAKLAGAAFVLALTARLLDRVLGDAQLMLFDPAVAVSPLLQLLVEAGFAGLATSGAALALAGLIDITLILLPRRMIGRITVSRLALGIVATAAGCGALVVALDAARERDLAAVVLGHAGTDESSEIGELDIYLELIVDEALGSPEIQAAVARDDLRGAALSIWSSGLLGDFNVPARVRIAHGGSGETHESSFDVPPGWQPAPKRSAVRSGESSGEPRWSLEVAVPLVSRRLVTSGTLEVLAAARGERREDERRILRAQADLDGRILPGGDLRGGAVLPDEVLDAISFGGSVVAPWTIETGRYLVSAAPSPSREGELSVVSLKLAEPIDAVVRWLRALLSCLAGYAVFGLLAALVHAVRSRDWRRRFLGRFDVRVAIATACLALAPLGVISWMAPRLSAGVRKESIERRLTEAPGIARSFLASGADADRVRELARSLGLDISVYSGREQLVSSRPELCELDLLPARANAEAARRLEAGRTTVLVEEQIGALSMPVAYSRLSEGMLVSAALPLGAEELARATAPAIARLQVLVFAAMALVIGLATWVAARITAPVRALTRAADQVAGGDLTARVGSRAPAALGNEIADLITSFERMVVQLEDSRAQLVAAEKEAAWREMARQVAHEIKNPLTPMRLAVQHLERAQRDGSPQLDAILTQVIGTVLEEIESLRRIAEDFSDFARFPRRVLEEVDLGALASEVATLYSQGDGSGVTVTAEIAPQPPRIMADPLEMRRVLVNLIKNSLEALAGREGGAVKIQVGAAEGGQLAELAIVDNGPGISADVRARLFEPYFSTKTSGTGLGLAIVHRAAEALGGTITAEDAPGGGAVFRLRVPAIR